MKRYVVLGIMASAVVSAVGQAQGGSVSASCAAGNTQDACQKAVDFFQYMTPQLGVMMTGGNATLGQGGTLGGLGHFVLGARGNIMSGSIPQVDNVTPATVAGNAQVSNYPVKKQVIGLPQVDAAIGLFKGIPLGVTNVGGVDLLVSAEYLPAFSSGSFSAKLPNGSLKFGFGGRLGIVQESILFPGVSVTYLRRSLPTADLTATPSSGDSVNIRNLNITTNAWRVVASKTLLIFGVAAGVGGDSYSSSTTASAFASQADVSTGDIPIDQKLTRTNMFFDLSLNLPILKLVGEVGRVSGGTVNTYNTFSGNRADDARVYGSAGLRLGF